MKNKRCKQLAAACFALIALWDVLSLRYFNLWTMFAAIGSILIVIALVKSLPTLATVGFSFWIVTTLRTIVILCRWGVTQSGVDLTVLFEMIGVITFAVLIFASLLPQAAKFLGWIAVFGAMVRLILLIILDGGTNISGILWNALLMVGSLFVRYAFLAIPKKTTKATDIE